MAHSPSLLVCERNRKYNQRTTKSRDPVTARLFTHLFGPAEDTSRTREDVNPRAGPGAAR